MAEHSSFLTNILTKISRRHARKGESHGAMKVGTGLAHDQLQQLRYFFGVDPMRISRDEEVRLHFDRLLQQAPEPFWVERIGEATGIPLKHKPQRSKDEQEKTMLDRLQLSFP